MRKLILEIDDDKAAAIEHLIEVFEEASTSAIEDVRIASQSVSDCIDAATSVYHADFGPVGDTFRNFAQQLREAERNLSRAEGKLAE